MKAFAGASNGKKSVTFYHDDDLKSPPPVILDWSHIADHWLSNAPTGAWIMDGERISNFKHQWVIGVVTEYVP